MRATIVYDKAMRNWPPTTYLVQVDGPFLGHEWVAILCQDSTYGGQNAAYVLPSNEDGDSVQEFMMPLAKFDYGTVQSVVAQMGYEL